MNKVSQIHITKDLIELLEKKVKEAPDFKDFDDANLFSAKLTIAVHIVTYIISEGVHPDGYDEITDLIKENLLKNLNKSTDIIWESDK